MGKQVEGQTNLTILYLKRSQEEMTQIDPQLLNILKTQCSSLGQNFNFVSSTKVLAVDRDQLLFCKISGQIPQVLGEARSLSSMEAACQKSSSSFLIPKIHAFGLTEQEDQAYLITDFKDLKGNLNSTNQRSLGKKLAEMHLNGGNDRFGFERPTFCGVTEQNNQWSDSWTKFFTEQRIGDMVKRINASGKDSELIKFECQMKEKVYPLLFEAVDSSFKPSIIHGDLWSGNRGVEEDIPIIFDPSSYYAHNEMELGIMNMFGGYTKEFFDSYHEVIPKMEPYYEERIKCYELYHHLNHALMFGGGYRGGAIQIMKSLIHFGEMEAQKEAVKSEL